MSANIQRTFAGGELAPALHARADVVKYATGLATCRNFFIGKSGGAFNRPGTEFIGEVKASSGLVPRLIHFQDSAGDDFLIEFGSLYARFIKDDAYVTDATFDILGVTKANPAVVTTDGAHGWSNGDEVTISGIVGMTELNGRNFKIANVTAVTFSLLEMDGVTAINSTAFDAWVFGGTASRIFTLVHTFNDSALLSIPKLRRMTHSQWGDKMVFAHTGEPISELHRSGLSDDFDWTWQDMTAGALLDAPANPTNNGGAGSVSFWKVTAVSHFGEESDASSATSSAATPSVGTIITVEWDEVDGAREYYVYRLTTSGYYGFIGSASVAEFRDSGFTPDLTITPDKFTSVPWADAGDQKYPGVVAHAQQRRFLARASNRGFDPNSPGTVWTSMTGSVTNFSSGNPIKDSDPLTFTLASSRQVSIQHIVELFKILIFTDSGEIFCEGNEANILTPTAINTRQISYNGASYLRPLVADDKVLYVQERGNVVHDISYESGHFGTDELSLLATHLFEGKEIVSWAYQKTPHSVVWAVRDDGILIGMTYIKKQEIIAWHKHDFGDDLIREVECFPSGDRHVLYAVIDRTIGGATKRYVEKFTPRFIEDIKDAVFLDSALSYDGRNSEATTMTLSGSGWTYTDTLTLTASASFFASTDVGNAIHMYLGDDVVRCTITAFTSDTVVSVLPHKTVPVGLQATPITDWTRAVDEVSGLWHLEGKDVSIFADGFVVANPNNPSYTVRTVADGSVTLDKPYGVIHVGLPYTSDLETLDIDTSNGETLSDKHKNISQVTLFLEKTRGGWVGVKEEDDDGVTLDGLTELKLRNQEGYDEPIALKTGKVKINIQPQWNSNGRILVRQTDPLPISVSAVVPTGMVPFRGGQ